MQIVPSTLIAFALVMLLIHRGRFEGVIILFSLIPFGMMAAFNLPAVGNTSILAVDLAAITLACMFLPQRSLNRDLGLIFAPRGTALPLMGFLIYAAIGSIFLPRVFEGATEVFSIGRVANQIGIVMRPLSPGGGNLSQLLRIMLSLLVFLVVVLVMLRQQSPGLARRAMIAVTIVHAGLGFLDIATQATGTAFILEPVRTANYALTLGQEMAGLNRVIGGFPEASSYSYVTLGLFGYWLSYWFHDKSGSRLPLILLLLTLFLILRGTSSSAYVGLALLVFIFALMRLRELASHQRLDGRLVAVLVGAIGIVPLIFIGVYTLYELVPGFTDFIDRSLLNKLSSDSGVERMSWNRQAFRNFLDTYMLGAGLGSVRASNWLVATLSTTGLVGLGLMLTFLWRLFRTSIEVDDPETAVLLMSLKMGCAGCIARSLVVKATPNLDFLFFGMAGLLVGLALRIHQDAHTQMEPAAISRPRATVV
ncbi:O-antigen ligase family protein [Alloyangia pacifica]|uniref:O-Antigen ligase n=1 Tax=Alloyangia pacifica TaxID=311180 RepID=A0A1I6T455_9RHOB|nr:O-antigen ligase family protein [Alloyangia pacifica]SDG97016.1 O-Antigen ligase [Alloyangia pacifica]SFS83966.1 O-Antigen ligase [Alloyangia pacifica]